MNWTGWEVPYHLGIGEKCEGKWRGPAYSAGYRTYYHYILLYFAILPGALVALLTCYCPPKE